jgi:hypothetical protein
MNTGFEPSDSEWDILGHGSRPAPRAGFAETVRLALDSAKDAPQVVRFSGVHSRIVGLLAAAAAVVLLGLALSNLLRSPEGPSTTLAGGGVETPAVAVGPTAAPAEEDDADEEITGLFTLERLLSTQDLESLDDEDLVALLY